MNHRLQVPLDETDTLPEGGRLAPDRPGAAAWPTTLGTVLSKAWKRLTAGFVDCIDVIRAPRVTIDLKLAETAGNAPFYEAAVHRVYREAQRPHPKFWLVPRMKYGVALQVLPATYEAYQKSRGKTARQNVAKARRQGYVVSRIDYNAHLDAVRTINRSTSQRQGPMPEALLREKPRPIDDPPSRSNVHDHVYYGVFRGDRLLAYSACLFAGEAAMITIIFGHAGHLKDGIVPLLIDGMAADAYARFPNARYYIYDMFYGGSETFRRFKRKFGFTPHVARWRL